jgi:hypothetical protein
MRSTICRGGNDAAVAAAAAAGEGARYDMSTVPLRVHHNQPCGTRHVRWQHRLAALFPRLAATWRALMRMVLRRTSDATPARRGRTTQPVRPRRVTECHCSSCDVCGMMCASLKKCGGVCGGRAWYCSRDCQRAHWPEHREDCRGNHDGAGVAPQAA